MWLFVLILALIRASIMIGPHTFAMSLSIYKSALVLVTVCIHHFPVVVMRFILVIDLSTVNVTVVKFEGPYLLGSCLLRSHLLVFGHPLTRRSRITHMSTKCLNELLLYYYNDQ